MLASALPLACSAPQGSASPASTEGRLEIIAAVDPRSLDPARSDVPESAYHALAPGSGKGYFVSFRDSGQRVSIRGGAAPIEGTLDVAASRGDTKVYTLDAFAGGTLSITGAMGARKATLTLFGSGVHVVSSERGPLRFAGQ